MPLGIYEKDDIDALADEIRNCKGGGSLMTVKEMTEEIRNVKEVGFSDGYSEGQTYGENIGREQGLEEGKAIGYTEGKTDGIAEGIEQGKKSQYDEFWDAYQDYGKRTNYQSAFMRGWNEQNFKPKYDIRIEGSASGMFDTNLYIRDVKAVLDKCGVVLDTSKATNLQYFLTSSNIEAFGVIDVTSLSSVNYVLYYCPKLVSVEKFVFKADGSQPINDAFYQLAILENLIVEGTIGQNGFNVQWSTKLSKASITSIINALSTTTSGLTVTISKTAINNAFNGGSTGDEWLNLVATKNNWTISLI